MKRNNGQHHYTPEEDAWLIDNYEKYTHPELNKKFNEVFGTFIKCGVTDHVIKSLHLKKKLNRGDYKKGERRCTNVVPVGSERIIKAGAGVPCVYVKIANDVHDWSDRLKASKPNNPNWKRKDFIVWEEHGNKLPIKGKELLIHLDKDPMNCSIENLYLIDRRTNFMLSKNDWHFGNPYLTLLAIKYTELYYLLKILKNKK